MIGASTAQVVHPEITFKFLGPGQHNSVSIEVNFNSALCPHRNMAEQVIDVIVTCIDHDMTPIIIIIIMLKILSLFYIIILF